MSSRPPPPSATTMSSALTADVPPAAPPPLHSPSSTASSPLAISVDSFPFPPATSRASLKHQGNGPSQTSAADGLRSPLSPVRRKPLPPNSSALLSPDTNFTPSPADAGADQSGASVNNNNNTANNTDTPTEDTTFVVRDLDRFPHDKAPIVSTQTSFQEHPTEGSTTHGDPSDPSTRVRLATEPIIEALSPTPPSSTESDNKPSTAMALHPPTNRPAPLRVDLASSRNMPANEFKQQPKTPGSKITSFFTWNKSASPGTDSASTEISESGLSPLPSPMPASTLPTSHSSRFPSLDSHSGPVGKMPIRTQSIPVESDLSAKVSELEKELREISSELAGSIRREMELEDLVDKLQLEASTSSDPNRRTSDYFSDSGTSSVRYPGSDAGGKAEDIEKIKRTMEQERAQLKVELSQKWQEERSRRQAFESHVQILEAQVNQFRNERVDASNHMARAKELETALEDTRRRLAEERELKDNFEDLLTAMRVDLEQHKNERDYLRNENAMLAQGRKQSRINSIAEEAGDSIAPVGLSRSNSLARMPPRSGLSRSGSVSRSRPTSLIGKDPQFSESLVERCKDVESQRDFLHQTVKSLLGRLAYEEKQNDKRVRMLEMELERARQSGSPRRLGYERDVRNLREEINLLRRRADDALMAKWQCEKGLGGLKMDLDRAEQETSSLRALLHQHDIAVPEHQSLGDLADFQASASSLENEYRQLQADQQSSPRGGSFNQNDALATQVHRQLAANSSLRNRLADAIGKGERNHEVSAAKINEMQTKLKALEEALMLAQQSSEEEITKHEAEINTLKENHNAQLLRAKNGIKSPGLLSPMVPTSPFSGPRSPRLARTTSGDGIALTEAVQTERLEARVKELERALRDADMEMEEVVSRMNKAQIEVAELQADKDEALRQTRRLNEEILAERQRLTA